MEHNQKQQVDPKNPKEERNNGVNKKISKRNIERGSQMLLRHLLTSGTH
jgi:hypothetical protein